MIRFYCDKCGEDAVHEVQISWRKAGECRDYDAGRARADIGHTCRACLEGLLKGFVEPEAEKGPAAKKISELKREISGEDDGRLSKEEFTKGFEQVWFLEDGWDRCKP